MKTHPKPLPLWRRGFAGSAEKSSRGSRQKRGKNIYTTMREDLFYLAKCTCFACACLLDRSCEPTRYESVGCDGENFSSLKEYEAKGEVFDAANFVRFARFA